VGLCLIATQLACADDFSAQREAVLALGELTKAPAWQEATDRAEEEGLKAIYFAALDYKGQPTKVFGWLGVPASHSGAVPGVVLVHGGGGTAFTEWVRLWTARGFAAMSIAVEGQTDLRDAASKDRDNPSGWRRHAWAGPRRQGIYGDSSEPLKDQWMYHAVADTILANSLLRSLPEVDAEKVGVMGISWGGVITSTVIGIDDRFAFAIPTYGCGNLAAADNQYGRTLGDNQLYRQVWDPMVRMPRVKVPTLWLSWPGDQHFPLDAQAACYRAAPGPHLVTLIPGMQHGHEAGWRPPESYAWAPWCRQAGVEVDGNMAQVRFRSTKPIEKATLISTTGSGFTGERRWTSSPAKLERASEGITVKVKLPPETTAWFVNLHSGNLVASSDFFEARTP
jgi:dienelactone hydrolase